jgi:hypothetical protein
MRMHHGSWGSLLVAGREMQASHRGGYATDAGGGANDDESANWSDNEDEGEGEDGYEDEGADDARTRACT